MAVHLFTDRIYNGDEIHLYAEGKSSRDYTYIDDIIAGLRAAVDAGCEYEIINLGRSDTVLLSDLVAGIETCLGKKARIVNRPSRPGDVFRTFADISKARALLGYEPRTSLDQGLKLFVEWYLKKRGKQ